MAPVSPPVSRSAKILNAACTAAARDLKYDSTLTRVKICEEFEMRTGGKKPYGWQMDVAEAIITGLDCVVVVGTGAGKTMPFIMPLLVNPKKHIIISPLDALEHNQVSTNLNVFANHCVHHESALFSQKLFDCLVSQLYLLMDRHTLLHCKRSVIQNTQSVCNYLLTYRPSRSGSIRLF